MPSFANYLQKQNRLSARTVTRNPRLCVIGIWTRYAHPYKADFVPNLAYACFALIGIGKTRN